MHKNIILVLGKQGQLAQAFQIFFANRNSTDGMVVFTDRTETDFSQPLQVLKFIQDLDPSIIINAAAYTAVDKAEVEPEIADRVNHQTPQVIAQWVSENKKKLIHYSTDYVFDGRGVEPHSEEDSTKTLNLYGQTKLRGDHAILASGAQALILRTSWVYSHVGHNFFRTMLRLGSDREELSIVNDQIGSPTYAPDLAQMTWKMLSHWHLRTQTGTQVYNVCGAGYCSWYDFANEIFQLAPDFGFSMKVKSIKPILSEEYKTPARRPLNSRLSQDKLKADFSFEMPHWKQSLRQAFENLSRGG